MKWSKSVILAVAAVALAGAAQAQDAAKLTPLSMRLNWQMKGEFAPFVVGVVNGYFRAEGLDVKINEGSSATQALQSVVNGSDDLAYVPAVQLIQSVNTGMPVKAVATVVKEDSMGMVAKSKVKLSSPKDLEGRTVEISAASTISQIWPAFAAKNRIDLSKVKVVRVAPSARFNLLLGDQVDVLGDIFMTNEYPVLQAKVPGGLNTFRVGDYGFKIIGYTIVASDKLMSEHPDLIRHFNAAAMKAFKFAADHPAEAAAIAAKAYPLALQEETTKGQVDQLDAFLKLGTPTQLFAGSDAGWTETLGLLKESGAISEQKAPGAYYTNAFLPAGS
ncbi:MAG TPA: ABC transporter substrate-binding protein [Pseudolabrys sp.]|jgi:ABC-type nitrate/sulfonate/bicarbonate transport system substrate-binding protein|nr:ABC transporter substrate-binding protein [Pseudolabrys sp.]